MNKQTAVAQAPVSVVSFMNQDSVKNMIAKSLPKSMKVDDVIRFYQLVQKKDKKLALCDPMSVVLRIIEASRLQLEFNGPKQECFLIPYSEGGKYVAQLQIGWRGLMTLIRRGSDIADIDARVVDEKDEFVLEFGFNPKLVHIPYMGDEAVDSPKLCYCLITMKDGSRHFEYMRTAEIEKVRKGRGGPWAEWWDEMAKKTVFKRAAKRMPLSKEIEDAINIDNEAEGGSALNLTVSDVEDTEEPDQRPMTQKIMGDLQPLEDMPKNEEEPSE